MAWLRMAVVIGLCATVGLFIAWTDGGPPQAHAYHTAEQLRAFSERGSGLPGGQNNFFMASGNCEGCHGHDFNGVAGFANGVDVNVVDDWRSTMMANSAHDPFWRAKVSHEVLVNPTHQAALEDKCTSCHAPMGRHDKFLSGGGPYSIAELEQDPLGLDGVSCVACHIQSANNIGNLNSGNMEFDTQGRPLYGPYADNIFGSPMVAFVGYEPLYGAHINHAGLCASCHTLVTETADLAGTLTGATFVEQATYHEWLNSAYNDLEHVDGITCQGCHVPRINTPVVISANYLFLQGRAPYGMHHFAGANTFMLELLKNNRVALGLSANETQFDSTIARTMRMLQQSTLLLEASMAARTPDTAFVDVKLTNLAGHKFPSGYPARRAFVELVVTNNATGDTLFRSGGWDPTYEVMGHDADWEPHHDVIRQPDQAQIYEMVMGDVNGDKTTVLERAASHLKDNRLTPLGFSATHPTYDTTLIAGVPPTDMDFNRDELGVEGSGSDIIHYHVPTNGFTGAISIQARVWYQSAPPRWMTEMFSYNSPEIDAFRTMYDAADGSPVLVKETSFLDLSVGIDDLRELGIRVFPNPVHDGQLRISGVDGRVLAVEVYDARGTLVAKPPVRSGTMEMTLPRGAGTYLVTIRTRERTFVERVVTY